MVEVKIEYNDREEVRNELNILYEAKEVKRKYEELLRRIENEVIMVVTDHENRQGIAIPLADVFDQEAYQSQGLVREIDATKTMKSKLGGEWVLFTGTKEL